MSRSGLVILGIFAVAALSLIALPFVLAFEAQAQATAAAGQRLAVYRAEAERRPALEKALALAKDQLAAVPGQLTGDSTPLAQAALQNEVRGLVEQERGEIRSTQTLPSDTERGFERVAVQYDLVLPVTHLEALLYSVETHTPYLFIDDTDISMPIAIAGGHEPRVEIRWTISGYRWAGTP